MTRGLRQRAHSQGHDAVYAKITQFGKYRAVHALLHRSHLASIYLSIYLSIDGCCVRKSVCMLCAPCSIEGAALRAHIGAIERAYRVCVLSVCSVSTLNSLCLCV